MGFERAAMSKPLTGGQPREWLREPAASVDHLVSASEERGWDLDVDCARARHVDDQFVLRRLLNGELGWLSALENLVDVLRRARIMGAENRAVSNQPALAHHVPVLVEGRRTHPRGEPHEPGPIAVEHRLHEDIKPVSP